MRCYILILFLLAYASSSLHAAQLVMVEKTGCEWCELWNEEIGPAYHKSEEGKKAPLVRYDIQDLPSSEYVLNGSIRYTPTFIVVEHAQEIGRIVGYPGSSFFWEMLDQILDDLPDAVANVKR